ncbi:MAG: hypothetical protein VKI42_01800, partial [Synechococcaceae cyanobacterium]|nr:hypothetical protein [Synechococcaceae cyanobacterium]
MGAVNETAQPALLQLRTNRQALRLAKVVAGYEGTSVSSILREGLVLFVQQKSQAPENARVQLQQALAGPASS